MSRTLQLAYSTCPNDTFTFHALVHGIVQCPGCSFQTVLADVEALNQEARKGTFEISKLSFAAIGHLQERYALLRSGAAVGRGCGPLIVSRPGMETGQLRHGKIAVPGLWTTARLLLELFLPFSTEIVPMRFDRIMPAIRRGEVDAGVIIHEGRFTYTEYELACLQDLGEWWETDTGLPIPLGGIALRRDVDRKTAKSIEVAISDSISYAFRHPQASREYVRKYAQELSPDVIQAHISLYVNDFSLELGTDGEQAVRGLFSKAQERGIIPPSCLPLFAY